VGGVARRLRDAHGYTAELGYEFFAPVDRALTLFDALMEAGATGGHPVIGVEAILIVRTESGMSWRRRRV